MIICALPPPQTTGWGVAGKRIVEELRKLTTVNDLNHAQTNGSILVEDFPVEFDDPLLMAIRGVDLLPMYSHLRGHHTVGYCFVEDNLLLKHYALNARHWWDVIVCGSTWALEEMQKAVPAKWLLAAIQGVDADLFCLNSAVKPNPEWFSIFSGGKFEFRKSQDAVIRAVAVMMERHRDVRLVASWWNPWKASVDTMRQSRLITMTGPNAAYNWQGDVYATACGHGIPRSHIKWIEQASHENMPTIMQTCDIGVFPNRCEAGTNLVLMEAMSCGMPVIATTTHGHADVTGHLTPAFALSSKPFTVERASITGKMAVAEWYEPDLDELVGKLEWAYQNRDTLAVEGLVNREAMKPFTWQKTAEVLRDACRV